MSPQNWKEKGELVRQIRERKTRVSRFNALINAKRRNRLSQQISSPIMKVEYYGPRAESCIMATTQLWTATNGTYFPENSGAICPGDTCIQSRKNPQQVHTIKTGIAQFLQLYNFMLWFKARKASTTLT